MDSQPPEDTPIAAIQAQTSRVSRLYQTYLDKTVPFVSYRWAGTGSILIFFMLRIVIAQGWYIVCYTLGIYLLNLFLAFLQPKFDPAFSEDSVEDAGVPTLPTKSSEEFRPFIRRLPEFKFWYASTRAITVAFLCTWSSIFDIPVFWPVLVIYFIILFALTMRRQIQHMVKYKYVPFSIGKTRYSKA